MTDVIHVFAAAGFFALAIGYVRFCDALRKGGHDER